MQFLVICLIAAFAVASAFAPRSKMMAVRSTRSRSETKMQMFAVTHLTTLMTALEEAKPDGYEYGAVNAPSFVLPLAAFGSVAIAGTLYLS